MYVPSARDQAWIRLAFQYGRFLSVENLFSSDRANQHVLGTQQHKTNKLTLFPYPSFKEVGMFFFATWKPNVTAAQRKLKGVQQPRTKHNLSNTTPHWYSLHGLGRIVPQVMFVPTPYAAGEVAVTRVCAQLQQ